MAGAPLGNQNAAKAKRWQQAIMRALARASGKDVDAGLDNAADKLVALAVDGEKWAIEEVGNRMDGKSAQSITVGGDGENPIELRWPLPKTPLDR